MTMVKLDGNSEAGRKHETGMPPVPNLEAVRGEHIEEMTNPAADEAAVRALYVQLMDGWNKGNGKLFAAPFDADGDLVGFDGTYFKGRSAIASFHQPLFDKWLKGMRLVGEITSVRFLKPDVAVAHANGGTVMRGKSGPAPESTSIQTLVAIKHGDQWKLAAFQNTRKRPIGRDTGGTILWLFTDWLWKLLGPRR